MKETAKTTIIIPKVFPRLYGYVWNGTSASAQILVECSAAKLPPEVRILSANVWQRTNAVTGATFEKGNLKVISTRPDSTGQMSTVRLNNLAVNECGIYVLPADIKWGTTSVQLSAATLPEFLKSLTPVQIQLPAWLTVCNENMSMYKRIGLAYCKAIQNVIHRRFEILDRIGAALAEKTTVSIPFISEDHLKQLGITMNPDGKVTATENKAVSTNTITRRITRVNTDPSIFEEILD